jgi:acetate kinase
MRLKPGSVLTINGGSSSIRFAVYETGAKLKLRAAGKIDRIGLSGTNLVVHEPSRPKSNPLPIPGEGHPAAVDFLMHWLESQPFFSSIEAIGHRVVHGMKHSQPIRITRRLLAELRRITPYDPDHLPGEIKLIETFSLRHPKLPQVACFDTAFHRSMPLVSRLLPIPRRYFAKGIERYGFHGLSYAYLMEKLKKIDPREAKGRVILAHLGSGASLAAVRHGKSIDTSMGFTPTAGLVMNTRAGDLDPGLNYFLARTENMTASQFEHMVNHESGLLGVSGTSSDLRDLCGREKTDVRAAEAVQLFCYQATKWIGSFAAALGGLDTLVFAGGIGENAFEIRKRICANLGYLGVSLEPRRNARNAALISPKVGRVKVRVIRTDEEKMIAQSVCQVLGSRALRPRLKAT